jgi:hypothetical protein
MGSSTIPHQDSAKIFGDSLCVVIEKPSRTAIKPSFSPFARVIAIESREDLSMEERISIWWQEDDYERFKTSTSKLVQTMLRESINGWLGMKDETAKARCVPPPPPSTVAADNSLISSPKRQLAFQAADETDTDVLGPANQKAKLADRNGVEERSWWQRYGDLACFHESRKRQIHARNSIRIVLKEQRLQQRMTKPMDGSKIRSSYTEATRWAIDWAIALAAARAEEVSTDFDIGRCREKTIASLYVMKEKLTALSERPLTSLAPRISRVCASQIRHRQSAVRSLVTKEIGTQHLGPMVPGTTVTNSTFIRDQSSSEKVHTPSLAKEAAGFGVHSSPGCVGLPHLESVQ